MIFIRCFIFFFFGVLQTLAATNLDDEELTESMQKLLIVMQRLDQKIAPMLEADGELFNKRLDSIKKYSEEGCYIILKKIFLRVRFLAYCRAEYIHTYDMRSHIFIHQSKVNRIAVEP